MAQIKDTYAHLLGELAGKYVTHTPASAFFYLDQDHNPGLRIESIELLREFINGTIYGKGPEGLLFYNEKPDFNNIDSPVVYKVYYNNEESRAVKIDFHYSERDPHPFTTFLARDGSVPTNILKNGIGAWRDLKIGTCSAEITKSSDWSTVTLKMEPIGKRVSFKVGEELAERMAKTQGSFGFPKLANLTGSDCVASYNNDRIIFSSDVDRNKVLAVFFPAIGSLGIDNHDNLDPPIATWEDL